MTDLEQVAEAMNLAAGLCQSEANKLDSWHKPSAEHWRKIAIRLQGGQVALRAAVEAERDVCAKLAQAVEPEYGWGTDTTINRSWADGFQEGKRHAAAAIRKRGE